VEKHPGGEPRLSFIFFSNSFSFFICYHLISLLSIAVQMYSSSYWKFWGGSKGRPSSLRYTFHPTLYQTERAELWRLFFRLSGSLAHQSPIWGSFQPLGMIERNSSSLDFCWIFYLTFFFFFPLDSTQTY
jgi:hypothetical protein